MECLKKKIPDEKTLLLAIVTYGYPPFYWLGKEVPPIASRTPVADFSGDHVTSLWLTFDVK